MDFLYLIFIKISYIMYKFYYDFKVYLVKKGLILQFFCHVKKKEEKNSFLNLELSCWNYFDLTRHIYNLYLLIKNSITTVIFR